MSKRTIEHSFASKGIYTYYTVLLDQLARILDAVRTHESFEATLVPRSAFQKLEMICWHNSALIGWLQEGGESVYAHDAITSGSFSAAIDHAWEKLHKGWKRRRNIISTLSK